MDGFELNKIVGALLGSVLVVMLVGFIAELLYHVDEPEVAGYSIDVPEVEVADASAEEEEMVSVLDLLATADVAAGESAVRRCASCHTFEEGGSDGVGPHLWGVVNRPKGSVDGFNYSDAMAAVGAEARFGALRNLTASSPTRAVILKARRWDSPVSATSKIAPTFWLISTRYKLNRSTFPRLRPRSNGRSGRSTIHHIDKKRRRQPALFLRLRVRIR
jgi:cytochrome c2